MTNLTHDDLKKAFGSFAGLPVAMSKNTQFKDGKPISETYEPALPKDSVMQALEDLTLKLGIECRVVLPDSFLGMDFNPDRLNVYIVRGVKNDWHIGQIITDDRRVVASTLLQTTAADLSLQEKMPIRKPLCLKRPAL
jgi:hypothetical protein